ncbi:putative transcription factor cys6 [Phaeomoniella chlamydospora]|uniref:Putative transcription factor cys6 n=1 Tax=Phaeomoniella chlamydospora TaxID=158046 RepID=A0A0G2FTE9_PHACM|nr:putative transcription factor cys6 [Phaeomoniella chlamydospora]
MATGSLYEDMSQTTNALISPREFATVQISKSIESMLQDSSRSLVNILSGCVLFATIGTLRDDSSGFIHLKSGFSIVKELQSNPSHPFWKTSTSSEQDLVKNLLIPILYRSTTQLFFVDPVRGVSSAIKLGNLRGTSNAPNIPEVFNNVRDAEVCHQSFVSWVLGHLTPAEAPSGHSLSVDLVPMIWGQSLKLIDAVDRFIEQVKVRNDIQMDNIIRAAALIKATHWTARVCLKGMNFATETDFDALEFEFSKIIASCKECLDHTERKSALKGTVSRRVFFGTDHSVLTPLSLVTRLSRNPTLRRKGIELMLTANIGEGMLASRLAGLVSAALMEMEETGLSEVVVASDIPESHRVRVHDISLFTYMSDELNLRVRVKKYPYQPIDGKIVTESIWLRSQRERTAVWDGREHYPLQRQSGPVLTSDSIEGVVEEDIRNNSYPDFTISPSSIAWLVDRQPSPRYHFLKAEHSFLERQILKF